MLASPLKLPTDLPLLREEGWWFERKLDGLRCLAIRDGDTVTLWSRNQLSFSRRFPDVLAAVASIGAPRFVIDGEIASFDADDRTSFQALQSGGSTGTRTEFVAFDLLHLLGHDIRHLPLAERAALLRRTLDANSRIHVSEPREGDPGELMTRACASGWEGLVAKRKASPYRAGRSTDWRKLKCTARQELVIGGWSEPTGSRSGFGALLLGYYEGGSLRYAGKVGTGFDERTLRSLHTTLLAMEVERSPFLDLQRMRGAHWVRPELVAEIEFTEWTREGRLRHPSFLGLRPDKKAGEVVREQAAP